MENLYEKIVNTIPVFFFLWSRDQKETIFISEQFYDEKSNDYYAPEEAREDLRQYIHPESQQDYDQFFANLSQENDYNDEIEVRAGDSLPNITWVKISTFPVIEQENEIKYIAGHISDVSNSIESSRLLQEQVESLDTVTFMLAHELSAPITNIMGLSELLKSKAAGAGLDQHLHLYDTIYNFGGEILTLAHGLVNLLHLQSSKVQFTLEETQLKPFVEKRLHNFYLKPNTRKTELSYSDIDESIIVQVEPVNFAKAIEESLVYLIKHIELNSQISITTPPSYNPNQVTICITSTGVKLSKESVERVLDRSSRLGMLDVTGLKIRGMLELVIAKEVCELHQGRLEMIDRDGEQGLMITLPRNPTL
ncbi:PAS domain-containing sensor histidine kinase [Tunicatimonas pelagia]|uniref:PAS domain-containing sensor histidine kinase n=1 Tax=Tunicatimonas pelagia TaxID=931531 RepID=UPI0026652DE2|nr:PAS domain-containing sensor histidine kinase [Tunicatimonas pelagia]WKN44654.1 PAS domain-containing sensor histidine kinase [Tunicatimonas pelagia]